MAVAPMIEFMSEALSSSALSRSGRNGSAGGGGVESDWVTNQMPTAQTATTNTSEMAAMIGHGLRLGLAGVPWFHGTEPERCCGTGMLGGGTPQLLYCGAA